MLLRFSREGSEGKMSRQEMTFIKPDDHLIEARLSPTGSRYEYAPIGDCPLCGWHGTLYLQEELTTNTRGHEVYTETAAQIRCDRCGCSTGVIRQIRSKSGKNNFDMAALAPVVLGAWNNHDLKL